MLRTPLSALLSLGLALSLVACATDKPSDRSPAATTPAGPAGKDTRASEGPPVANKVPKVRILHGDRFVDDYFWLRDKGTPEVESYLRAEAAWAKKQMAPLEKLQDQLYEEIVSHIAEDDSSVPVRNGKYEYWFEVKKGREHPVFLRQPVKKSKAKDALATEIILDQNELAEGKAFLALGAFAVSDDGNKLLFSTDDTGFRLYSLQEKDLKTGQMLPERVENTVQAVWASDGKTIFYTIQDDAKRPYRVYRHVLGTDPKTDALVYEEADERFHLYLGRTMSRGYIVLHSESQLATEVRLVNAKKPASAPILVEPRSENLMYDVEHDGRNLIIRANDTGKNFRLVTASPRAPGKKRWKEIIPHDAAVMIEHAMPLAGRLVLHVRKAGVPELEIFEPRTKKRTPIAMPESDHDVWLDENPMMLAKTLRFGYQSLKTPRSYFEYDLVTKKSKLLKETPVPGGFDRDSYETARLEATAHDGTKIPISLVAKKGTVKDGSAPLLLEAYGSYGRSYPVAFKASALPLLDRGVVLAIAHIRGGGELGKAWHEAGRLGDKMNSFTDFIASAEHLIAEKWTSPKRLVIHGLSAGGLLMGAVTNMRPDLFQAVVNDVPFVDVINTMNDPTLPLTVNEYEEWGNPGISNEYDWMRAYSPYDNIEAKDYPALFVRASYNDSQVMYWEPAKYVARLRAHKTDKRPLLFRIHMDPAGHHGKSGRYERHQEEAEMYAFVLWQQGLAPIPPR